MKFVHLKQFLGIEMISGVLKNRLSGLDDSNWFKNTSHCNWYVLQSLLFLKCFEIACVAGRIVSARKVWQSGAAKPRRMECKILHKVLRKFRGLSKTFLCPYAVSVVLATGALTSNQFTSIPKGNAVFMSYIIITCFLDEIEKRNAEQSVETAEIKATVKSLDRERDDLSQQVDEKTEEIMNLEARRIQLVCWGVSSTTVSFRLGNLDSDFEIRVSDFQLTA